ncbi:MAG: glycosyltransferase family 2 protein [Planctomycetota bacterium]|jgi:glycosyltransferase involved in cell wall biosynthesis
MREESTAGRICAVIPAYNEADRVGVVVRRTLFHVDHVVVVDDGSADATAEAARSAGADVVRHDLNRGKGAALATGLQRAAAVGFEGAVTLDADGQHDSGEIPHLIETFRDSGADIVLGTRMRNRRGMPVVRALTNLVTSIVISCLAGRRVTDSQCGFRVLRLSTAGRLPLSASRYDTESEILVKAARLSMSIKEVPINTIYAGEQSKINPLVDTWRFIRLALRLIFVERGMRL